MTTNTLLNTKQRVIWWRKKFPLMAGAEIARKVGVKKQRVQQILKGAGLPNRHASQQFICLQCGKVLPKGRRYFCNNDCQYLYNNPTLICAECEIPFSKYFTSRILYDLKKYPDKKFFCSNHCKGVYLGKHHTPADKSKSL